MVEGVMDGPLPVPPLLPGILAEELNSRVHKSSDLTLETKKAHRALVDVFIVGHPEVVQAALVEAAKFPHFEYEVMVEKLLPHLVPLAGVREFPPPLYTHD